MSAKDEESLQRFDCRNEFGQQPLFKNEDDPALNLMKFHMELSPGNEGRVRVLAVDTHDFFNRILHEIRHGKSEMGFQEVPDRAHHAIEDDVADFQKRPGPNSKEFPR